MQTVNNIKDLEEELKKNPEVLLLLTDLRVHIPGDERSRTNPGHGYPAHDVSYMSVEVNDSERSLEESILVHDRAKRAYLVLDAKHIKIGIKKSINIIR